MTIRFAVPEDAAPLLAIYAQFIDTPITFEYTLPSVEAFRARIVGISARYPYLVLEEDGRLLGYAYAHPLRDWAAYDWDAELSIYLDPEATGRGWGRTLYAALVALLRLQRIQNVYGCVTSPNPASEGLHDALGFQRCGSFHRTGYKSGVWRDVIWFEKAIGTGAALPEPVIPITQVEEKQVRQVLEAAL